MTPTSLLLFELSVKIEKLSLIGGCMARVEYLSIKSPFSLAIDGYLSDSNEIFLFRMSYDPFLIFLALSKSGVPRTFSPSFGSLFFNLYARVKSTLDSLSSS